MKTDKIGTKLSHTKIQLYSVADPGFPRGGGANPKGGGANLLFGQFFPKTAWKWRNFGPGGARPPLRSATGISENLITLHPN